MPDMISDGRGSNRKARVDVNHRLSTRAVTESEEVNANEAGDAYNINTGVVTLTDSVDTPMLYIKNNEERNLVIVAVAIGLGPDTGGSSSSWVKGTFIRNPTAGTIISGASAVPINSNRNYGSTNSLTADIYKGATGSTMTDGDDHILVQLGSSGSRSFITINEVLPKGTSFGVKIDPRTSNTSMDCYVAAITYLHTEEE